MATILDKKGFPELLEEKLDLATTFVADTKSGNPLHDKATGEFAHLPSGVRVIKGAELLEGLSKAAKTTFFERVAITKANQVSARILDGNLHIVLLRDGRRLDSFQIQPKEIRDGKGAPGEVAPDQAEQDGLPEEFSATLKGSVRDAVIEAARDLDLVGGSLIKFLEEKTGQEFNPAQREAILILVDTQRINDLIDYLDQNMKIKLEGNKQLRKLRILTPRGYLRKTFARLSEEQCKEVIDRLRDRGWSEGEVQDEVIDKLPERLRKVFHVEHKEANPESSSVNPSHNPRKVGLPRKKG